VLDRLGRGARTVIVNDALIALEAGVPGGPGAVLIAGTGSFAYGRDDTGRAARAGGWGYVLGDEGSGYWLGRQALRVVVRASDGRGPQTDLTDAVLKHYNVPNAQGLVRKMAGAGAKPSAIADLARLVSAAAAAGDSVARRLISSAAHELSGAADSVVRRLGLERAPLFLTGGILRHDEGLRHEVISQLAVRLPDLKPELLAATPAQGAVHLAIEALNGTLRLPMYLEN
jgi:N-acetylglucosamine kinase-like BadF-type ATPase